MLDEIVPAQLGVLARERMKPWNLVMRVGARVAARLDEQHFEILIITCKPRCEHSTARPRSDDDEVEALRHDCLLFGLALRKHMTLSGSLERPISCGSRVQTVRRAEVHA